MEQIGNDEGEKFKMKENKLSKFYSIQTHLVYGGAVKFLAWSTFQNLIKYQIFYWNGFLVGPRDFEDLFIYECMNFIGNNFYFINLLSIYFFIL